MKNRIITSLALLLISSNVLAKNYPIQNQRYEVNISLNEANKLAVLSDRIKKVYGKQSDFSLQPNNELGVLYIIPKTKEPFNLSVVTEKGLDQDFNFVPKEIKAQNITLYNSPNGGNINSDKEAAISNVISLAHKMDLKPLKESVVNLSDYELSPYGYRNFKYYKVKLYKIKNLRDEMVRFEPSHFSFASNVVATAIDNSMYLDKQESGMLYVVEEL